MRVKIHIPDTLGEITLEQYQEYLKIQEQEKDQYVLGSKMIEIFCKVPFKNIFEYILIIFYLLKCCMKSF